ncbi:MAG: metallophosphoesterase [Clostridium sp.]|nr:metallophosphoesterase [Clostridium sp.]
MRKKRAAVFAIAAGLCLTVSGCQGTAQTGQEAQTSSEAASEPPETQSTDQETEESAKEEQEEPETEESQKETQEEPGEEPLYEIVLATDIHYLAEELAGNRCQSFIDYVYGGDGRVLLYSWEILDAFIEDMKEKDPDLLLISGDLTLNGEKASHEELASLLEELDDEGIPVLVIPGNHDINNPYAKRFSGMNSYQVDSITAEEFEDIYAEFGYVAADSRDPNSLSYLYKVDSSLWLLMLDSCQYDPVNQVGGMIQSGTYNWMEPILYEAWENDTEVITVSHHNLLEQSGVSDAFYDDCTIEHSEELLQMLSDNEVRLHLSGHLHLQHYMEEDDVAEVVTGSLVMAPCRYGVVDLYEDGSITYHTETVNVEKWARENSYKNPDLADFFHYSENFLHQISYEHAVSDLERQNRKGTLHLSDDEIEMMSQFYAKLCVYYYGGKMYEIADEVREDPAAKLWDKYQYASELSDFLRRILEDEAKDFGKLYLD